MTDIFIARKYNILKLVALGGGYTRKDIMQLTKADKNVVNSTVNEFIDADVLVEREPESGERQHSGRRAMLLSLSERSPLICGMLIKRGLLSVVLGTIGGEIIASRSVEYTDITKDKLISQLVSMYDSLRTKTERRIIAVGISSIGPVNQRTQSISPAYFFDIIDFRVADIIAKAIGLPVFLMNDVNAGALAEKLYGNGRTLENFIYIHIMNGIGAGFVLDGQIYNGSNGKSGELGHTSVDINGPLCECGSRGCLDLYTDIKNINLKLQSLQRELKLKTCLPEIDYPRVQCTFSDFIDACNKADATAMFALDGFCDYLSVALVNMLNLLDIDDIIIGYENCTESDALETLLQSKLNRSTPQGRDITIRKSHFFDKAPLYGSVAVVCERIYSGELRI